MAEMRGTEHKVYDLGKNPKLRGYEVKKARLPMPNPQDKRVEHAPYASLPGDGAFLRTDDAGHHETLSSLQLYGRSMLRPYGEIPPSHLINYLLLTK